MEIEVQAKTYLYMNVYNVIHNSQKMEETQGFINGINTCYTIGEPWKHFAVKETKHIRPHMVWFHSYEISRLSKFI